MRTHTSLIAATLLAAASTVANAGIGVGASIGAARANGGDFEGSETAYKGYAGLYGDLLGVEVAYVNFGSLGGDGPDTEAWAPAATLGFPVGAATIFGKIGWGFAEVEGSSFEDEFSDDDVFFGGGVRFAATDVLGFRLEYERFTIGEADLDLASAGVELRF